MGSPAVIASGIANYRQLRVADAATYGSKYFVAYSTFDPTTSAETVNLLAYNADGTPLPSQSSTLASFTTVNGKYDSFLFGTLLNSRDPTPSYIYIEGYEQNQVAGVQYQQVSTDGKLEGSGVYISPPYPAGATLTGLDHFTSTRLVQQNGAGNDYAILMAYSYADASSTRHAGVDVRILDTKTGTSVDRNIALSQSASSNVSAANLPNGGLVVGYTDQGISYLQEYDASGTAVGNPFALPSEVGDGFSVGSLGDGRVIVEYTTAAGDQLKYDIYDTRQPATAYVLAGRASPQNVVGSSGNDVFYLGGSGGADTISGGGGTDFIATSQLAGSGLVLVDLKDGYVEAGSRVDAFVSGVQGVVLGAQSSTVLGLKAGTDIIYGGSGADAFYNEGAVDYIRGGTGTNNVVGGAGTQIFYGGGGSDAMIGGKGTSFMQAGPTASSIDYFYGNGGTDYVYGGPGSTTLVGGSGTEMLTGGSGFTQLVGSSSSPGVNILKGVNGTDAFYGGIGTNVMYEGSGVDAFQSGGGTDFIYGGSGTSYVTAGSGTDVITSGAGNQQITAGKGHTYFNDVAAHLTAGRLDNISNFMGGAGTDIYLPGSVESATTFVAQNGGTAVVTAVAGGNAEIFASNASVAEVQSHTHFTL